MINLLLVLSLVFAPLASFSPFLVDGPSMQPTLHGGDVFVLNTEAYESARPERGDIVVFFGDGKPDYLYVKRIVGLPGERIHVTTTGLYLEEGGGKHEILEPYVAHADESADYTKQGYKDELFIVPKDKYFVLGDNRDHSVDSRTFIHPFIPIGNIKGKYIFTLLDS